MNIPERFTRWREAAVELGFEDFLTAEDSFRRCLASNGPWVNKDACGIYFWVAQDGETYVGQTLNARARLREHWRRHPDLSYAAFQPVPRLDLDAVEQELIREVGRRFATRNIKHAIATHAHVPFDDFVSENDRLAFAANTLNLPDDNWRELPLLTQKKRPAFARFMGRDDAPHVLSLLRSYISSVIPRPAATEARFWSVSLLVQDHVLRVNVGQQEVFTISSESNGRLYVRLLTLKPFGFMADGPHYQSGSYANFLPRKDLNKWLAGQRLLACRELVLQLMRHTTALNSGSHCPQIVRAAFAV